MGAGSLFRRDLGLCGRAEDLRSPGDQRAVAVGLESALLTRDEEGGLHAFYETISAPTAVTSSSRRATVPTRSSSAAPTTHGRTASTGASQALRGSGKLAGFDPSYASDFWDITNGQDWRACEGVQRGVSSGAVTVRDTFEPGRMPSTSSSPWSPEATSKAKRRHRLLEPDGLRPAGVSGRIVGRQPADERTEACHSLRGSTF